jgi:hypothetical protein
MRFLIDWPGDEMPTGGDIESAMKEPPPVLETADGRGFVTWDPNRADGMHVARLPDPSPTAPPPMADDRSELAPPSGPPLETLEPLETVCQGCGTIVILGMQDTGRAAGNCAKCGRRYIKDPAP